MSQHVYTKCAPYHKVCSPLQSVPLIITKRAPYYVEQVVAMWECWQGQSDSLIAHDIIICFHTLASRASMVVLTPLTSERLLSELQLRLATRLDLSKNKPYWLSWVGMMCVLHKNYISLAQLVLRKVSRPSTSREGLVRETSIHNHFYCEIYWLIRKH